MNMLWTVLDIFCENYPYSLIETAPCHYLLEENWKENAGTDKAVRQFLNCTCEKIIEIIGMRKNSVRLAKKLRNWDGTDTQNQAGKAIRTLIRDNLIQPDIAEKLFEEQFEMFQDKIEMTVVWNASSDPGEKDRSVPFRKDCHEALRNEYIKLMEIIKKKNVLQDFFALSETYLTLRKLTSEVNQMITSLSSDEPSTEAAFEDRYLTIFTGIFMMGMNFRYDGKISPEENKKVTQNIYHILYDRLNAPAVTDIPSSFSDEKKDDQKISTLLLQSRKQLNRQLREKYSNSDELRPELLGKIKRYTPAEVFYHSLNECYTDFLYQQEHPDRFPDTPKRICLHFTGDMISGRTSQLLDLWDSQLQKNKIVWYIPAEELRRIGPDQDEQNADNNAPENVSKKERKWESLISYIFRLYLPKEAVTYDPFMPGDTLRYRLSEYLSDIPVLLLIDDLDFLPGDLQEEAQNSFISGGWFENINVIYTTRSDDVTKDHNPKIYLCELDDDHIMDLLRQNGLSPNRNDPAFHYLGSPWFLKLVLDERPNLSAPIATSAMLIYISMKERIRRIARPGEDLSLIEFSEGYLLPLISLKGEMTKRKITENIQILLSSLEDEMDDSVLNIYKNNISSSKRLYNYFFDGPFLKRLDLFKTSDTGAFSALSRFDGKNYEWKETVLSNYYHALGVITLLNLARHESPDSLVTGEGESMRKVLSALAEYALRMSKFNNFAANPEKTLFYDKNTKKPHYSPEGLTAFSRSCFFLEFLDPETEAALSLNHPKEMIPLYSQMSSIYERFGDAKKRYRYAAKTFDSYCQATVPAEYENTSSGLTNIHSALISSSIAEEYRDMARLAAYFIIKTRKEDLNEDPSSLEKKKLAYEWLCSALSVEKDKFKLSKLHAVIGAYLLSVKNYPKALDHYKKTLELRQEYLKENTDSSSPVKKEAEMTMRKCYVMLGTASYYLKDYAGCVAYHKTAIEYAQKTTDNPFRYESYSRMVGAVLASDGKIAIDDQEKTGNWTAGKLIKLLEWLNKGISLMEIGNCMNRNELKDILGKAKAILQIRIELTPEEKEKLCEQLKIINDAFFRNYLGSFEELRPE